MKPGFVHPQPFNVFDDPELHALARETSRCMTKAADAFEGFSLEVVLSAQVVMTIQLLETLVENGADGHAMSALMKICQAGQKLGLMRVEMQAQKIAAKA